MIRYFTITYVQKYLMELRCVIEIFDIHVLGSLIGAYKH